jgi:hypothetical protein
MPSSSASDLPDLVVELHHLALGLCGLGLLLEVGLLGVEPVGDRPVEELGQVLALHVGDGLQSVCVAVLGGQLRVPEVGGVLSGALVQLRQLADRAGHPREGLLLARTLVATGGLDDTAARGDVPDAGQPVDELGVVELLGGLVDPLDAVAGDARARLQELRGQPAGGELARGVGVVHGDVDVAARSGRAGREARARVGVAELVEQLLLPLLRVLRLVLVGERRAVVVDRPLQLVGLRDRLGCLFGDGDERVDVERVGDELLHPAVVVLVDRARDGVVGQRVQVVGFHVRPGDVREPVACVVVDSGETRPSAGVSPVRGEDVAGVRDVEPRNGRYCCCFRGGTTDGGGVAASEVPLVDLAGALAETTCSFPNIGSSAFACRRVLV